MKQRMKEFEGCLRKFLQENGMANWHAEIDTVLVLIGAAFALAGWRKGR